MRKFNIPHPDASSAKKPKAPVRKTFGRSSLTAIGSAAVLCGVIVCIIAAAPKESSARLGSPEADGSGEVPRIAAPAGEDDDFLFRRDDNTYSDESEDSEPIEICESIVYASPEVTETAEPETAAPETTVPVTTVPETTAPVTTAPETTAPVTTAPETTTPETTAPDTTVPVVSKPETSAPNTSAASTGLLSDKLELVYSIEKPGFTVSDREVKLVAAIIQCEVMGRGSSLYAFDDVKLKYWEMLAVAQCIRNRMLSDHFEPDTVEGIVFQSTVVNGKTFYQFSPASTIESIEPTEEAVTAAKEVLRDGVTLLPDNYYYFCASSVEARFEKNNSYSLVKKSDGSFDKTVGDTTTFYAGFKN